MKRGIDVDRIDPEFLMDLSDPIEAIYEAIEHDLLVQLAKRFDGRKVPKSKVPGSTAWRAYMLEQIGGLTEDNIRLIAAYTGDVSELTQLAVRLAVETAIDAVEPELAKLVRKPEYVPERSQTAQRVVEAYAAQALNQLNLVNTVMLNSSLRAYEQAVADTVAYQTKLGTAQKALNEQTGAVIMGAVSRQKAVESAVKRMASVGLTGFTDAAGRNWSAQAYVQMDIRTTAANAARQAVMDRNAAHGNNLISVSSHPGARPLCAPYQGKVFSTDGTTGTVEDLHGKSVEYTPLSGTSYGQPAGLFGVNCGHLPSPFIPGVSVVRAAQYDPKENAAAYEQTQQQRYMERRVRRLKTQADALEAAGDVEGAKALRGKARQVTTELMEWCDANGRDFYPERVRVLKVGEAKSQLQLKLESGYRPLTARDLDANIAVDVSEEVRSVIDSTSRRITEDIPELDLFLSQVAFGDTGDKNPAEVEFSIMNGYPGMVLAFNAHMWKDLNSIRDLVKSEAGTTSHIRSFVPNAIPAHEYGHIAFNAVILKRMGYTGTGVLPYGSQSGQIFLSTKLLLVKELEDLKTTYGNVVLSERGNDDISEYVAEAFSDHYYGENHKVSEAIVQFFKEALKNGIL